MNNIHQLLLDQGVLHEGHFVLSSGRHTAQYMQMAKAFEKPWIGNALGDALAKKVYESFLQHAFPTIVVTPAVGGILAGYELARHLMLRSLFSERDRQGDNSMILRRGFSLSPVDRVLIAEDVITTGKTTREVIDLVRSHGAEPVAVACVVDRTAGSVDFGVPFLSLCQIDIPTYAPEDVPEALRAIPVSKPGSR